MTAVKFIDTTIRDGNQSVWALSMRTRHMRPALPILDAAGYDQIELMAAGSAFKKFVRHLGENPWNWIRTAAETSQHTPLRWHGVFEGWTTSGVVPPELGLLLHKTVADLGVRYIRMGDNWNRFNEVVAGQKERLERIGVTAILHLVYSVSPRHTDEYFVEKTKEAAALRPFRLCLKDVGGLLTPERTTELIPKLKAVTGDIPWEFHGHCNNGLGPLNALAAVRAGINYIHTAVPPLANGNSLPSVYNVADNLRALGYEAQIADEGLRAVSDHFRAVAKRERLPESRPYEYTERLYSHQIPGGMISNLEYQLRSAGIEGKLDETLDETARVRADFGYPIMVTPLSQFVASQAAINVIVGERYQQVTDQTIEYALGLHGGSEALNGMDPNVRDKILDRPRARQLEANEEVHPTLADIRDHYGHGISDEDLILRAVVGDDALSVLANSERRRTPIGSNGLPLVELIQELAQSDGPRYMAIHNNDLSLKIRRAT